MSKQYINTASASDAHESDILDVAITSKYTITVSSDGYANFWDNKLDETTDPKSNVFKQLVDKIGLHHVAVFEAIIPDSKIKVVVVAVVSFSGKVYLFQYINDDVKTLATVDASNIKQTSWAPGFFQDPQSKRDYFVVTQASGETLIYNFAVNSSEDKKSVEVSISDFGKIQPVQSSFPNSLAISNTEEKRIALGYTNGDVLMYDLESSKPIYTFKSTDVQNGQSGSSSAASSIPRAIKFSPGGSLLAVARDNQSAGSITLYDAKYGENVGSLTTPQHFSKTNIGGFAHDGWIMALSFDSEGKLLASCGFDKYVRVWNLETRERVATINISSSDLDDFKGEELDSSVVSGVSFIKKGVRGGIGGDTNEGLCVISFDRGVRWFREAGGI